MSDFFSSKNMQEWGERLLVVLLLDYILLFGVETILPGFVMGVFNLNYLLVAVLILVGYLALVRTPEGEQVQSKKALYFMLYPAIAFVVIIAIFSLYKAMAWQVALYIILAFASGTVLYKNLTAK